MTKADKSKTTKKTQTPRGQKGMASKALESLKALALKSDLPDFKAGDKLVIKSKIKEGDKEQGEILRNQETVDCIRGTPFDVGRKLQRQETHPIYLAPE